MLQVQAMVGCESLGPQFRCGFFIGAPRFSEDKFLRTNIFIHFPCLFFAFFEIEHVGFSKRGRVRSERIYECLSITSSKNANIWRCEEVSGTLIPTDGRSWEEVCATKGGVVVVV